jgi:4,5-DOPA dioxygenase extradiol
MTRMPVAFVGHGAPMLLDDAAWVAELAQWGKRLPKPQAIVVVSAHWETEPVAIGDAALPLVYDFSGFPERFYRLQYATPDASEVTERVKTRLNEASIIASKTARGLDHGVYIPLLAMFPKNDVPVVQVSLPGLDLVKTAALGSALAPLADEGTLLVGSGFVTHNMQSFSHRSTPEWAAEFDAWTMQTASALDVNALVGLSSQPHARLAHPRHEHFSPLVFATAAAKTLHRNTVTFPIEGFWSVAPAFSKRSVQYD